MPIDLDRFDPTDATAAFMAAERANRLEAAIQQYLDWGATTGSDRDYLEGDFRLAISGPCPSPLTHQRNLDSMDPS